MTQRIDTGGAEMELGYWAIRGLAQPIRFLLAHADVPFSEVRLGVRPDGSVLEEEEEDADWAALKPTLDVPFPNLPYLIDRRGPSPVLLTQSNAILRYLGRQLGYYGDSEAERTAIDVLQEEAYDYRNKVVKAAYTLGDDYAAAYAEFKESAVPRHLDGFERYLERRADRRHLVGSRRSLVDFVVYELVWQTSLMVPGSVDKVRRPALHEFLRQLEAEPAIEAYRQDEHYLERPINSPWASFA